MLVAVVNRGRAFTVPPVVVTFDDAGGGVEVDCTIVEELFTAGGALAGLASMKADGGSPPNVAASAAFSA
jgi:hypothetical protein